MRLKTRNHNLKPKEAGNEEPQPQNKSGNYFFGGYI